MLSNMNLEKQILSVCGRTIATLMKDWDLLDILLLLLKKSKCFWEDGTDWAPAHLKSNILAEIWSA